MSYVPAQCDLLAVKWGWQVKTWEENFGDIGSEILTPVSGHFLVLDIFKQVEDIYGMKILSVRNQKILYARFRPDGAWVNVHDIPDKISI